MNKKVWLLIALAIAFLSVSVAAANSLQSSPVQLDGDKIVVERIDGEIFIFEPVQRSENVRIDKVTTIYPNGTTTVAWLKAWYENGAIYADYIEPPP